MMRATVACLLLAACGGGNSSATDAPPGGADGPGSDGGPPDGLTCTGDQVICGAACVDLATDPMHCGSCDRACPAALGACYAGTCVHRLASAWQVHFGAGSFPGFWFSGVTTDAAGNVYVAGTMNFKIDLGGGPLMIPGGGGAADILVASFTPAGAHRWSRIFGSAAGDGGDALVLAQGTLYVLGEFQYTIDFGGGPLTSAGREDIVVLGLDPATGGYVSARRYGNADHDSATSIAADADGNIVIAGGFRGSTASIDLGGGPITAGGATNGYIASFTPAGTHRWSRPVAQMSAAGQSSNIQQLTVDAAGNVIATGGFQGTGDFGSGPRTSGDHDIFVTSYTSVGALRWVRTIGGAGYDFGHSVAADGAGNVYAGGLFGGPVDFGTGPVATIGSFDGYVLALAGATGATRFARALGSSAGAALYALHVAADGTVLATGGVGGNANLGLGPTSPLGSFDIFLAGLSSTDGKPLWGKRYGGDQTENGLAITSGPSTEILMAGHTHSNPIELGTGPLPKLGTVDNGFVVKIVP